MSETINDLSKSKIRCKVKMVERWESVDTDAPEAAELEQLSHLDCTPWSPTE